MSRDFSLWRFMTYAETLRNHAMALCVSDVLGKSLMSIRLLNKHTTFKCIDCRVLSSLWSIILSFEGFATYYQCQISGDAVMFFWRRFLFTSVCLFVLAVCRGLIKNGERQDEESMGGRRRTEALRQLCQMNPSQALNIRAMVVSSLS